MTCAYCGQTQPTDKPCWGCASRQPDGGTTAGGGEIVVSRYGGVERSPLYQLTAKAEERSRMTAKEDALIAACNLVAESVPPVGIFAFNEHQAASSTREELAGAASFRQPTRLPLPVPGERGALQAELESWALENGFGSAFAPFPPDRDNSAPGQSRETPDE